MTAAAYLEHLLGLGIQFGIENGDVRQGNLIESCFKTCQQLIHCVSGGMRGYSGSRCHAKEVGAAEAVILAVQLEGHPVMSQPRKYTGGHGIIERRYPHTPESGCAR